MVAVEKDNTVFVDLVLAHEPEKQVRATYNTRHVECKTALMVAADNGHTASIDRLLAHVPEEQLKAATADRDTALMVATKKGDPAALGALLAHASENDFMAVIAYGRSALGFAAGYGHLECLNLARMSEEQIMAADEDGTTALVWAAGSGHAKCLERLLAYSPEEQVRATHTHYDGETDREVNRRTALMHAVQAHRGGVVRQGPSYAPARGAGQSC